MEVVINDLEELKKYMRVYKDKKEIILKFDEVVFNCAVPNKDHFNYFQGDNILHYTINLKANKITFNYFFSIFALRVLNFYFFVKSTFSS